MEERKEINTKNLDVKDELDCGIIVIKLYKVPVNDKCNRNITGENRQGNVIWQIEDINPLLDCPFSSIRRFDEEKIIAYNWIGTNYYIYIQTGKLEIVNKDARLW
jgi:hypothetical protein